MSGGVILGDIVFETGRLWDLGELEARSIALDGAVQGPAFDQERQVYSFDHHGGCIRHVTLATCEQVRDALLVGLRPAGFRLYINDVDADSVLSTWLLLHPERLVDDGSGAVLDLVRRVGRIDALGPGVVEEHPVHRHLSPPAGVVSTLEVLKERLAVLDSWWSGGELPPGTRPPTTARGMWIEEASGELRLVEGDVEGGFLGLYRRADFGVIWSPAPGATRAYTVAKRSEFVRFDLTDFYDRCNVLEPGWGGGSTVGGAPRLSDGSRSELRPSTVGGILRQGAMGLARRS